LEQAQANLGFLLSHREERLAILGDVLMRHGVDLKSDLQSTDVRGCLDKLYSWMVPTFRAIYDAKLADWNVWLGSHRSGKEIAFSLTMDISIVIGELIVRNRPTFEWGLDLDPDNVEMMTYQRPVVQIPKSHGAIAPVIMDVEAIVVEQYRKVPQRIFGTVNELLSPVMLAISGAYERRPQGK
jgi:hypothetical protein